MHADHLAPENAHHRALPATHPPPPKIHLQILSLLPLVAGMMASWAPGKTPTSLHGRQFLAHSHFRSVHRTMPAEEMSPKTPK